MGVSCSNETKCLQKVYSDGSTISLSYYAEFENNYFAKGAFRYCFKGKIKNLNGKSVTPGDFPSGNCVVKV